jgi:hypothetical protein
VADVLAREARLVDDAVRVDLGTKKPPQLVDAMMLHRKTRAALLRVEVFAGGLDVRIYHLTTRRAV